MAPTVRTLSQGGRFLVTSPAPLPPEHERHIRAAARAIEGQRSAGGGVVTWPEPLSKAAFHGIAGEWTSRLDPHTEADPAALLIQLLVSFGNAIGHSAFY